MFFDYRRQHEISIKLGRIFNTYGPRKHTNDGRVVFNLIVQALLNIPVTIYVEGEQTRSFCYVSNMVGRFLSFMETGHDVTGPINLGSPNELTIREIAEQIIEKTGSSSSLVFKPLPSDDPKQRRANIHQAKFVLDWEPTTYLSEGLDANIPYFEKLLAGRFAKNLKSDC